MAVSDDDLRVGHPERERAIAFLNDAFSTGYLDVTEFEERSGGVYSSRTRGDLRVLVADLPNGAALFGDPVVHTTQAGSDSAAPIVAAGSSTVAGGPSTTPAELTAEWDTVRRKGSWHVPRRLLLTGSMGTFDLDFRKATFDAPSVDVELQVSATTVKMRLGADQSVQINDVVTSGLSSTKDKAGPALTPGGVVISVRGSLSAMSGLVVKR